MRLGIWKLWLQFTGRLFSTSSLSWEPEFWEVVQQVVLWSVSLSEHGQEELKGRMQPQKNPRKHPGSGFSLVYSVS